MASATETTTRARTLRATMHRTWNRLIDRWHRTDANGTRYPWNAVVIDTPEGGYLGGIPGDHTPGELQAHIDDIVAASAKVLEQHAATT